jgi:4'-phosphopantetheinyl transferase
VRSPVIWQREFVPIITTETQDVGHGISIRFVRPGGAELWQVEELLTQADRDYFTRDQIGPRRELRMLTRAALREWLGAVLNMSVASVPLTTLPSGRLELTPPASVWSFSVSTRGDLGLVALGPANIGSLGVDVEKNASAEMAVSLGAPAISELERRQRDALPPAERPVAALRQWVRKEAVAKALGLGVAAFDAGLDLSALSLVDNPGWQYVVTLGRPCHVRDLAAPAGHVAALAIAEPPTAAWKNF